MNKFEIIIFGNRQEVYQKDEGKPLFKVATFYSQEVLSMFMEKCRERKQRFVVQVEG